MAVSNPRCICACSQNDTFLLAETNYKIWFSKEKFVLYSKEVPF